MVVVPASLGQSKGYNMAQFLGLMAMTDDEVAVHGTDASRGRK